MATSNEFQRPSDLQTALALITELQETVKALTADVSSLKWKLSHGETQLELLKAENKFLQDSVSDLRIQQREILKMDEISKRYQQIMSRFR